MVVLCRGGFFVLGGWWRIKGRWVLCLILVFFLFSRIG